MSSAGKHLPPNVLTEVKVLVVDDEDILAWSIDTELKSLGAEVTRAGTVREAILKFQQVSPDVAICDLRLPDGNGLELLKKWHMDQPDMPVILITAHGAVDSAITALRLGAFDYLQKPFDMKDLIVSVRRASEMSKLRQKVTSMTGNEAPSTEVNIIGNTPVMHDLKHILQKIAKSKSNTALILGESGTGKELAARAVHEWSTRVGQPFVEINCASIPETLLESELFGYEKGAFTDARDRKLGLFEIAKNGSIFLDEIGEMPHKLQSKLLRALEYRRFKRLGGTKDIEFTGRIIAATNRNLLEEVAAKRFRADLYYRLNVLPVSMPSLSERLDDIEPLTDFFLKSLCNELGLKLPKISPRAIDILKSHAWPGNVRELRNVLQRALVFHEPEVIEPRHIELDDMSVLANVEPSYKNYGNGNALHGHNNLNGYEVQRELSMGGNGQRQTLDSDRCVEYKLPAEGINLDDLEKSLLVQALETSRNNQTKAALLLGISRHTLRYRLEKHGLAL
jgi:two-component system response regulator AtoC